jgi:hypothetical protein
MALDFPVPGTQTPVNTWSPTSTPSASTNGLTYIWDGQKWGTIGSSPAAITWNEITGKPDFDALYVETAGDEMSGNLTVPSLNSGPFATNQIINGDFSVWQRDINFYNLTNTDRQYTCDRWQFFSSNNDGSAGFNVNRDDDAPEGLTYSARVTNAGATNASGYGSAIYEQKVEGLQKFSGSTWTVSCYVKAGGTQSTYFNLQALGNYGTGGSPTSQEDFGSQPFYSSTGDFNNTSWTQVSFTFTVPDITANTYGTNADSYLRIGMFGIGLDGSQNFKVSGFQLEPGPVCTPFSHRPIGQELSLCQRYYLNTGILDELIMIRSTGTPGNGPVYGNFRFPTTMRVAPLGSTVVGDWNTVQAQRVEGIGKLTTTGCNISSENKSLVPGSVYNAGGGSMQFDAEL